MKGEYFCPNARSPKNRPRKQTTTTSSALRAAVKRARRKYWRRAIEAVAALSQSVCFCPGTIVLSRPESAMLINATFAQERPTSKMSHDGSWRASCLTRNWIPILHLEVPSVARGVTAPGVGSGALLGRIASIRIRKKVRRSRRDRCH
jgi:hypothetical protein